MEDFIDWVPVYTGDQSLPLETYLQKVSSFCTFYDLSPRKQLLLAENRCSGPAAAALAGKSFSTLTELRQTLEDALCRTDEDSFNTFCRVKQAPLETVSAFSLRVQSAFQRTSVSDAPFLLRTVFLKGLHTDLQQQVYRLAPVSFEDAVAKAKTLEADNCSMASPAWSRPAQEAAPVPRPCQRRTSQHNRQPTLPSEPQLCYEADDLSFQLEQTTDHVTELLHAFEAAQGSAGPHDPTASCDFFELADPPAVPACQLSALDAIARPLRSFLDRTMQQPDLPDAVMYQLDHCSSVLCGLETAILTGSRSPVPASPIVQTATVHQPDAQSLPRYSESPFLTVRSSPLPLEAFEPAQPAQPPVRPSFTALDMAEAPTVQDSKLHQHMTVSSATPAGCLPGDFVATHAPVESEDVVFCHANGAEHSSVCIGADATAQLLEPISAAPDASLPAESHAAHHLSAGVLDLPSAAAQPLQFIPEEVASLPCEPLASVPEHFHRAAEEAVAPLTLRKADHEPVRHRDLGTAAIVLHAGSFKATATSSDPSHMSSSSDLTELGHGSSFPPHTLSSSIVPYISFDPGGLSSRHNHFTTGDGVMPQTDTHEHSWMPGTGITLVIGRGDCIYDRTHDTSASAANSRFIDIAFMLESALLQIMIMVAVIMYSAGLPYFTEPPDPG